MPPESIITDAQLAALLAVLSGGFAGIAAAIKWAGGRIIKTHDTAINALIDNAKSHEKLATKIDAIAERLLGTDSTPTRIPRLATDSTKRRGGRRSPDDDNEPR
jgi:hypothetical protein